MIAATPFFSDRGCHIRIYNEIKYLKKEGIEVVLCTYHLGHNIDGFDIKRVSNVSWYKKITPGASWGKFYLDFLLLKLSYKEYLKNKPRIIHAHLYEGLCIAFIIKVLSCGKVRIVFDCQGSLAAEMYAYTLHKSRLLKSLYYFFMILEKLLLYMPNTIFCSSVNSYDFIIAKYHVQKDRINILNDGVDEDLFSRSVYKKDDVRSEMGIPKDNIVILYTGSLTEAKGVKELFDSIPSILQKRSDISFVFAGYGNLENEYSRKLAEYVKSKNVFFTGRFSYFDLPKYCAMADYAIDPKKDSSESTGKLLNYVAGGVQVICFKNKSNFEILGETGLYIDSFFYFVNILAIEKPRQIDLLKITWKVLIKKICKLYDTNLNVLFLIDKNGFGGVQTIARQLIDVNISGIDLYFLYLRNIEHVFLKNKDNVFYDQSSSKYNISSLSYLIRIVKMKNIDIVHLNGDKCLIFGVFLKLIIPGIKLIHHEHGPLLKESVYYNCLLKFSRSFVDKYIAVSKLVKSILIQKIGISPSQIAVVPNFVNLDTRKEVNIAPGVILSKAVKNIGYVGRLAEEKGCRYLLEALPFLRFEYYAIIIGDGVLKGSLSDLCSRLKITEKVCFAGFREKPDYGSIDVLIVPSLREAFGISVIEAQASGIPVIATDAGALVELIQDGETGLLFKPKDVMGLVKKIDELFSNAELYRKIRTQAKQQSEQYSLKVFVERIATIYACL